MSCGGGNINVLLKIKFSYIQYYYLFIGCLGTQQIKFLKF